MGFHSHPFEDIFAMVTHSLVEAQPLSNADMDSLALRVKAAREAHGMTQGEVARRAGMRQAEISKLESGSIAGTTKMAQLARALMCDPYWLATGDGEMFGPGAAAPFARLHGEGTVDGVEVVGGSEFMEGGVDILPETAAKGVIALSGFDSFAYAVRVRGDRNAPALKDGQFAVFSQRPVQPGETGLFTMNNGTVLLRELLRETSDSFYVDSAAWGARQTLAKSDVKRTEALVAVVSPAHWVQVLP